MFDIISESVNLLQVEEWVLMKFIIVEQKEKFVEQILEYYKDDENCYKFQVKELKIILLFSVLILIDVVIRILENLEI